MNAKDKMMKLLITGSSGYIGYVLSRYFSERGTVVVGVDINENPVWSGNGNFIFARCSVMDLKSLEKIFASEKPEAVIHLAYLMNPIHDAEKNYEIDVEGSRNVVLLSDRSPSVSLLIIMSSASAYGTVPGNRLWIKETEPLTPGDYRYGVHKKIVEEWIAEYGHRADLRVVLLRMCTAIGPSYHKKGGVVSILEKSPFLLSFNRNCAIQFIHEEDMAALIELIVGDEDINGTFNLAPDSFAITEELVPGKPFVPFPLAAARGITGLLWALRISEAMPSAVTLSARGIVIDPAKLKARYGYSFRYSTAEGYRATVEKRKELGTL